ncbi:MAG: tripartite ATP-independent transporter DctM subunit [Loktanella salsilacus]|jgi:tripartite ATP-independent transporter DctM subunit|uniref:TRAP transporter large permease protein n=1 Tax=Loktanella salsilacus TaxID=195913 RepID=A0A1I4J301_9RHOB|nr:TRAP transporter large permease [Loktanella salsilacus]MBU0781280.1 TRAP transporter large permease [Alphaproteobacteria bacterium]MBU1835557.1 TRAP transporter large permease [Alphaproteobacteria bacterium]UTH46671.1 TRAP transporter large permease [Loktanella salsilacus]UTH50067.1 TRAP transporter large permease [Loktanella salsilacus]SFL60607.1 TRAP transporter, DctM subunit [Loktanella salsilacus]
MIISTGLACAILVGGFLLLVLLRVPVAFALGIATIPVVVLDIRLTPFIVIDRMFQSYNSFILLAVPFFLLAANLMNSGKITDKLIELARVLTGWMPGGLGHVNVAVSMLFAGISGSSTADAAGCGKILIPAMVREGYDTRFAIAITACSSVMGVIIPPSILMVVWGGVMQVSVGALFLAGAIPGLLIGLALMATVYGYAKVYDYPTAGRPNWAEFWHAFKGAALAMLTPVLVIGGIVGGIVTPTESAIIAAGYALILGMFVYRTVSLRDLGGIFYDTGRFASISLFAIGTASAFGWMLAFFNVPRLIVTFMTSLEFGYYGTALVIAGLFLFFGLFIDAIPTIIILGTVLLPVAAAADIHPVVFAIIGIVSLAFGLVTPPYGLCLLISASIGGMNVVQVMRDVVIILIPMLLILLLIIIFPEIALWLPKTLMPTTFR